MAKGKGGAGGGINSNKLVHKPVRTGMRTRAINERGVSQIGSSIGNHSTDKAKRLTGGVEPVRGALRPAGGPGGVPLGNEVAARTVAKPGGSRTLYGQCGSQSQYGPAAGSPKPQGRSFDEPPPNKREY
jgi:hypothetical protein